ncbi:MAG TPA: tRNA preQ1(34) S-adenosylmethionine ribosyltransferase-isomerase QueA [Pyrinomonadaceae bacterium]|nr:tRNA preQ1(34) S-adenosylmethionine ribosyltransferase-isomerase QueA [Pyrinomonadaceae bacterium]HMP65496.1 tRNA preQ1(34) S-adenosylmethionine ribosyltransferase-isomerase QueA [Pyrinomonadaceae bacterium]
MQYLSEYRFDLPEDLIADVPLAERSASRMLVVDREASAFSDSRFLQFPDLLREGDLLVLNNTRVFPARLFGKTRTGASVELLLVREIKPFVWEALARPAKRLKPGVRIVLDEDLEAEVLERLENGSVSIRFLTTHELDDQLDRIGKTPLPPYIKRPKDSPDTDRERYQTVFAKTRGAIAAPTAGLHFTPEIFDEIKGRGVGIAEITLHVGYGTFEPVRSENLSQHRVLPERYSIDEQAARMLNSAREGGGRIVAVGTTTTRTLEYQMQKHGVFTAETGLADLTILPGYELRAVDALLTNFHLPRSSLLILVSTFAGHELIMRAYRHAVESEYRFYSYGDCMFIT